MLGRSTNTKEFAEFLVQIRKATPAEPRAKLVIVLDNHKSHHGDSVRALASDLNFELLYLPTYTPQLNPIESLWSVVKGKLKKKLQEKKEIRVKQCEFEEELNTILRGVTAEQQAKAARENHRAFIYQTLSDLAAPVRQVTLADVLLEQRWNTVAQVEDDRSAQEVALRREGDMSPLLTQKAYFEQPFGHMAGFEIVPDDWEEEVMQ
jgi:transposase